MLGKIIHDDDSDNEEKDDDSDDYNENHSKGTISIFF